MYVGKADKLISLIRRESSYPLFLVCHSFSLSQTGNIFIQFLALFGDSILSCLGNILIHLLVQMFTISAVAPHILLSPVDQILTMVHIWAISLCTFCQSVNF